MKRQSGILMHISSLYGDYSTGTFGRNCFEFIDFIKDAGFSLWQVLPFTVTDEYNSPYKSFSAFGGNPFFIDPEELYKQGLLTAAELKEAKQNSPYSCEFARLNAERFELFRKAYSRIDDKSEIESFIKANPHLESFCRFMTLRKQNNGQHWRQWKDNNITDFETLGVWQFTQYEFYRQWSLVKAYAREKGVSLIGDIPFYVSDDSCDVWECPEMFQLDENMCPKCVAGVPPDYFAEEGQLWGNPLYNWDMLRESGYSWWRERINHTLSLFDGVRIDHFRAIEAYWSVDSKESTAKNGKWIKGPGLDFINAIKCGNEDKLIIAEDLGDITEEVRKLVENSGFPGMRVFQFGFSDDSNSVHLPHNYIRNSVAYTGTHDNNTLFGFLWESPDDVRGRVLDYCGFTDGDWGKACPLLLRSVFASVSDLAIIPIQDFLMYGSDTRINTPGVADGNWSYRVTKEQLRNADIDFFRKLNKIYRRTGGENNGRQED